MDGKMIRLNIERETIRNNKFRNVLYTDDNFQLVLMSVADDIPEEKHSGTQFIRIEKGMGVARIGNMRFNLKDGDCVIVPPNTLHYIKNTGNSDLKLYSIYTPPEHH